MTTALQGCLLDQHDGVSLRPLEAAMHRTQLTQGAWFDLRPGWLTGSDHVFTHLLDHVDWQHERRWMYDREVDTPRLLRFYDRQELLPHDVLDRARTALTRHYAAELGEPFVTAGLCLYRDGRDSVAWHGDTHGRSAHHDTMVAIISLGTPRPLALRPRDRMAGGRPTRLTLGHGDLLVMGGSCQRTWEHAIPKLNARVGPRISVQFRPADVR